MAKPVVAFYHVQRSPAIGLRLQALDLVIFEPTTSGSVILTTADYKTLSKIPHLCNPCRWPALITSFIVR
jgi:hypothetical protein